MIIVTHVLQFKVTELLFCFFDSFFSQRTSSNVYYCVEFLCCPVYVHIRFFVVFSYVRKFILAVLISSQGIAIVISIAVDSSCSITSIIFRLFIIFFTRNIPSCHYLRTLFFTHLRISSLLLLPTLSWRFAHTFITHKRQ